MSSKYMSPGGVAVFAARALLLLCVAGVAALSACGARVNHYFLDGDGGPGADAAPTCGQVTCDDPLVCRYGQCIPDPASCTASIDCEGDTYCDPEMECIPFGIGPGGLNELTCSREVVPGVFVPRAQCEWLGPPVGDAYPSHKNVLGTPMVADVFPNDSEFPETEIVFISYNCTDGGGESCRGIDPACYGVIRVIDGKTCRQLATIATPTVVAATSLALGDLDGDGDVEIVGARTEGGLAAWTLDATETSFAIMWQTASNYGDNTCNWAGPSIYDLDDDGSPEVLLLGAVYGADGTVLDETLAPNAVDGTTTAYIPVVADVDDDGKPELLTGTKLYDWDVANTRWVAGPTFAANAGNGHIAVADLGTYGATAGADNRGVLDGVPELAVVTGGRVRIVTITGRLVFDAVLPGANPGAGGPPTIADFDGDGRAEIGVAGLVAYAVFDPDCAPGGTAATCASGSTDGRLWSQPSQDASSNRTGSSVFDFEGDGRSEVVYGDECFTRVYDGTTGQVMYSRYRTSCTWYENPVVADVDADFNAEIVSTSNTNCSVACPTLDPIFDGISCLDDDDCPSATTCGREAAGDALGRCRCSMDEDCGGDNFVCRDPIAGPSAQGKVCRASHAGPATAFGVRVIADSLDRWVNTRPIWNQHAYSVTNVGDDGSIPRTSAWLPNWLDPQLNSFRANAPGDGIVGDGRAVTPDLTARQGTVMCTSGNAAVKVQVCNRGTEPVGAGVAVAARQGASVICVAHTERPLRPTQCVEVSCVGGGVTSGMLEITVDDDGTGAGQNTECREANNSVDVPVTGC